MNNNTLAGWYSTNSGIKDYGGGILSLGPTDGGGDRALGAAGAVGGKVYIALRLQNLTTASISGVSVMFDGEEWYRRAQGNGLQVTSSLNFAYQVFDAPNTGYLVGAGWTNVPALTFISPNATLNTNQIFLDGNAPENSVHDIQALITGFDLEPGQELWLRWGSDTVPAGIVPHGLGIESLSVSFITAIPEPAAFAGLAGLGALGFALSRRRTRLG